MSGKFGVLNPYRLWKKGDMPCDPTVTIVLNEYGTKADGSVVISSSLASDSEIDFAINRLQEDIELVRKGAKKTLKSQRDRIHTWTPTFAKLSFDDVEKGKDCSHTSGL